MVRDGSASGAKAKAKAIVILIRNFLVSFAITTVFIGLLGLSGPWVGIFGGFGKAVKPFLQYKPDLER